MFEEKTLNMNWNFCFKITATVVLLYFLFVSRELIIWFIFALILSILFNFSIDFLEQKKIPRILAAIIIYFGFLAIIGFSLYKIAPIFLLEIKQFSSDLPLYFQKISPFLEKIGIGFLQDSRSFLSFLENNLEKVGENAINALVAFFGGVKATIFIISLSFFLSLEKNFLEKIVVNFAPAKHKEWFFNLLPKVKKQVSGWFFSRLIGVLFVGSLCYLFLSFLQIKHAFIFSFVFGVFDFIPVVGPLIAGVIIVLTVMTDSLSNAFFVLIGLIIIQQIENNFLFPILFKKLIGLPPVLVLMALAVGGTFWGFLGAILAIPLAGIIFEIVEEYLGLKKQDEEKENKGKQEAEVL
ncbi:AI-2E family transporter [Patescibacteria group bacterium]|nr:AI-2E family transporter [Patescibacteria group bacterium]